MKAGDLSLIDWAQNQYTAYYAHLPELTLPTLNDHNAPIWGMYQLLNRHPSKLEFQDMQVLSLSLRLARLEETDKLLKLLSNSLALSLREHRAPPFHATKLLLALLNNQTDQFIGR